MAPCITKHRNETGTNLRKACQITQATGRKVDRHHATLRLIVADNVVDVAHGRAVPRTEVEHVRTWCWQETLGCSGGPQQS